MGSEDEFESFYRRQFEPLVGALWVYCGDRLLAEEFAAEALARAARDWRRVAAMASQVGWLHRVAFNVANSHFRRRRAERRALARHGPVVGGHDGADVAGAVAVRAALRRLPPRQRQAVALFYFSDLSVAQVADVMDAPANTVKSLLHRARATLRGLLGTPSATLEEDVDA